MGSGLGYALTGAVIGLGDDIVRRAEDKRALARDILKQRARTAERAEDRKLDSEDRAAKEKREDTQRAEDFEFKRETLGKKEAGLDRRNRSRRRGLGQKYKKVSTGLGSRLGRDSRFQDRFEAPDMLKISEAAERIERLMNEFDLSEAQAVKRNYDDMIYEEEIKENSSYWDGKSETTRTERNREGRGKWTGEYDDGSFDPGSVAPAATPSLGGGNAADISHIPQEAIEFLRQNPNLRAEFDAQFGPGSAAAVLGDG